MSCIQEQVFCLWPIWIQLVRYSGGCSSHNVDEVNFTTLALGRISIFKVTQDSPRSDNSLWDVECKLSSFASLSKPCVPEPWLLCCFCASRDSIYTREVRRKGAKTVFQIFAQLKYERRTRASSESFYWASQSLAPEQYFFITLHRNIMKTFHRLF